MRGEQHVVVTLEHRVERYERDGETDEERRRAPDRPVAAALRQPPRALQVQQRCEHCQRAHERVELPAGERA